MQSRPSASICSARSGVTPKPSAAFSTLATAKSMRRSAISRGRQTWSACLPARPLTSPIRAMRTGSSRSVSPDAPLRGVIDRAGLADHAHLDGAGVIHFLLDPRRDVLGEPDHVAIVRGRRLHHHPQLLARPHGVRLADALGGGGDRLEAAEPLDEGADLLVTPAGTPD